MSGRAWTRLAWVGMLLIALGVAGLGHRTIAYTDRETQVTIGSVELATTTEHRFRSPLGVSIGLIVIGAALMFRGTRA